MIIGYDFWLDEVFPSDNDDIISEDNDGVAFDNCNIVDCVDTFVLKGGTFDEVYIAKTNNNADEIIENTEKQEWNKDTVLLAKFNGDLIGGTLGIDGESISQIEVKRRKKGDEQWQVYYVIDYFDDINLYTIIDRFIESEETYEYCIAPKAGNKTGTNSTPQSIYVNYDHAHIFDNTASFDLIYNLKIGTISQNIGANIINTLASAYPYVVYSQDNYSQGSVDCLLVSEESATGNIDLQSEKILRNNILAFLCNKEYKVLKNADGLYMLIKIIDAPTLTASEEILGVYNISFDFVQVGDVNNVNDLASAKFNFDYFESIHHTDEQGNKILEEKQKNQTIGGN